MALASTQYANQALNALDASGSPVNLASHVQLNTASPGTTGANEMASSTRQACTWNAAASGSKTNSSALTFTNPGTNAATHFSTWSAVSAGTFGIGGALSANVTAPTITVAAGALTISAS
jgi:hypothetical protein